MTSRELSSEFGALHAWQTAKTPIRRQAALIDVCRKIADDDRAAVRAECEERSGEGGGEPPVVESEGAIIRNVAAVGSFDLAISHDKVAINEIVAAQARLSGPAPCPIVIAVPPEQDVAAVRRLGVRAYEVQLAHLNDAAHAIMEKAPINSLPHP